MVYNRVSKYTLRVGIAQKKEKWIFKKRATVGLPGSL